MVLIICTNNESNLTNRYWDMVPDRQKVWTHGRRQNYIPPTSSGDKNSLWSKSVFGFLDLSYKIYTSFINNSESTLFTFNIQTP